MSKQIPAILDDSIGFNIYRVALLFRSELQAAQKNENMMLPVDIFNPVIEVIEPF